MSYSSTILAEPSLVSYWKLDEASGTLANDSKSTNNGTYNNCTVNQTSIAPSLGTCAFFNGSSSSLIVPTASALHPTAAISLECWIKPTVLNNNYRGICGCGNSANISPYDDYTLNIDNTNKLFWYISNPTSATFTITYPTALTVNTWYYVVGTYDGTIAKLYVNNVLVASQSFTTTIRSSGQPFVVGLSERGGASSQFFQGYIDEVALYNSALSSTAINSHYNPSGTNPNTLISQEALLTITKGSPKTRISQESLLVVNQGSPRARISQSALLVVAPIYYPPLTPQLLTNKRRRRTNINYYE